MSDSTGRWRAGEPWPGEGSRGPGRRGTRSEDTSDSRAGKVPRVGCRDTEASEAAGMSAEAEDRLAEDRLAEAEDRPGFGFGPERGQERRERRRF